MLVNKKKHVNEKKTNKKRKNVYDLRDDKGRPRPLLTLGLPRWRDMLVDEASEMIGYTWLLFPVTGTVGLSIPISLHERKGGFIFLDKKAFLQNVFEVTNNKPLQILVKSIDQRQF